MDSEGKVIADFFTQNLIYITELSKAAYGKFDGHLKVKLKTAYNDYLTRVYAHYSKSKSFFFRDFQVDLYSYYVPIGVRSGELSYQNPSFRNFREKSRHAVFSGSGGCGKSVMMRHLYLSCLKEKKYIPIFVELRSLNTSTSKKLENLIEEELENFGFKLGVEFIEIAKKKGHFAFFFDGYDEVNRALRSQLITDFKKISRKYPECPVLISTRPEDAFKGMDEFRIFNSEPLSKDKALELVSKLPFDDQKKQKFIENLKAELFDKHKSFLSNPLLLSIMLLTFGEYAEIPSKLSIFYNHAYETLYQKHDANKGGYERKKLTSLDIQDFSRVFQLFSLQSYETRLFKMPRSICLEMIDKCKKLTEKDFNNEDFLHDLVSATCLLFEDGLEIAFSHRSFQEYFVAIYISNAPPNIQRKLILRYWKNALYDDVLILLFEINPDLVERELIIPLGEKAFREIGVKRDVGKPGSDQCFLQP